MWQLVDKSGGFGSVCLVSPNSRHSRREASGSTALASSRIYIIVTRRARPAGYATFRVRPSVTVQKASSRILSLVCNGCKRKERASISPFHNWYIRNLFVQLILCSSFTIVILKVYSYMIEHWIKSNKTSPDVGQRCVLKRSKQRAWNMMKE